MSEVLFLVKIGFLPISIWDLFDILIVGSLFYVLYKLARGHLAFNILIGAGILLAINWLVNAAEMSMLSFILSGLAQFGFIVLVVVFQPEIRRFLIFLGQNFLKTQSDFFRQIVGVSTLDNANKDREKSINKITSVVFRLAQTRTGALIIFINDPSFYGLDDTGVILDAQISGRMIESIFHKESPLHDGAMLISENKVYAVGCILPVSENQKLPKSAGLRHRAGVGVTEQTEALAVIVSEETGKISVARNGRLTANLDKEKLSKILRKYLSVNKEDAENLILNDELSSPSS